MRMLSLIRKSWLKPFFMYVIRSKVEFKRWLFLFWCFYTHICLVNFSKANPCATLCEHLTFQNYRVLSWKYDFEASLSVSSYSQRLKEFRDITFKMSPSIINSGKWFQCPSFPANGNFWTKFKPIRRQLFKSWPSFCQPILRMPFLKNRINYTLFACQKHTLCMLCFYLAWSDNVTIHWFTWNRCLTIFIHRAKLIPLSGCLPYNPQLL